MDAEQLATLERFAAKHPPRKSLGLVDGLRIVPRERGTVTEFELRTAARIHEVLDLAMVPESALAVAAILTQYRFRIQFGNNRSVSRQDTGEVRDTSCARWGVSSR
jgi:hypothetical protein